MRVGPALFADDTPIKMQTGGKTGRAQTARMWSYVRDERPWCGQAPPGAWYQFSVDRKGAHPSAHLRGCTGIVHADGFTGFNGLFGEGLATEQACMVHVRRKFVDVFERDGSTIAGKTIERIARLYAVEKDARYKPPDERVALRQARAKPIFDELESWLKSQLPKISGKTKLAEAIRYALGRMPKARAYLENGQLELDNNICERSIRPLNSWAKKLSLHGLGGWRQGCCDRLHPHRNRPHEPRRPGSLADVGVDPHCRSQDQPHRRTRTVELAVTLKVNGGHAGRIP